MYPLPNLLTLEIKFGKFATMKRNVREPIQVYMTEGERAELDQVAASLGVSRSEVLRRGVTTMGSTRLGGGPLMDLIAEGVVTPAKAKPALPPTCKPVARLSEILKDLDADREDR